MHKLTVVVLVLLAAVAGTLLPHAAAQSPAENRLPQPRPAEAPIHFEDLTTRDGLAQNSIISILQDRRGFMWFGSETGLNRYDGYEVEVFRPIAFDSTSLSSGTITALAETRDGALWIGTVDGLNRMDPASEQFTRFMHDPDDPASLGTGDVWSLMEDASGTLWVGMFEGLYRMRPDAPGRFTSYRHDPEHPHSLSNDWVGSLLEDEAGMLWVGTSNGLNRLDDEEAGRFTRYLYNPDQPNEPGSGWPDHAITSMVQAPGAPGVLWVGTGSGLVRFDTQTGAYRRLPVIDTESFVTLAPDPTTPGLLWMGSDRAGLYRVDTRTGEATAYRHASDDPNSPSSDIVISLYPDRTGSLWAGTSAKGVNRFDPAGGGFRHILPGGEEYPERILVHGLTEDRSGKLWIGTAVPGLLARIDRETGARDYWIHDPANPATSIGAGRINDIHEDQRGTIWVTMTQEGSGLYRMDDARRGRFTAYVHDPDDPGTLSNDGLSTIYEARDGTFWIGAYNGELNHFDPATGRARRYALQSEQDRFVGAVNMLVEDDAGRFWVGTRQGGLIQFDPETGELLRQYLHDPRNPQSPTNNNVYGIYRDADGILWLTNYDGGFSRFDPQTEQFIHYTTANSDLPDNGAYHALKDENGFLWISTNGGLSRFDPRTESFLNFDVDDGLQSQEFSGYAAYRSPRTGEMFFGGVNGVNAFYPTLFEANDEPPQVALTGFRLNNALVQPGPDSPLEAPLGQTDVIRLRHDQDAIGFDFVALHYKNPGRNRYAYQLEGFDEDWIEAGEQRMATYTNLPPGRYTFRVKAANSDGVWNEEGASVRVVIDPPWWRTLWAYLGYGLLFIGGVFAVDRVQRRRLLRKEREAARERELAQKREIERAYTELKTTKDRLVQQEKLASLGALTAGIAHEIKNPLNFVNNFAALSEELVDELKAETDPEEIAAILADLQLNATKIREHGERADSIVRSMMQHARGGDGQREAIALNAFVDEYVDLAYHGKRAQVPDFNTEIVRDYGEGIGNVEIVPQEIGRVLINLLGNAFDAVREQAHRVNGQYEPTVRVSTCRKKNGVEIRVEDNGPGIPDAVREKIFEPFFTTKPTGSGTGLGLSMSYDIITQGHGGTLEVDSNEGQGATFVVKLPAQSTAKQPDVSS